MIDTQLFLYQAVLESRLRNFACLSTGDVIAIHYNDRTYELSVLETRPAAAVTVIECDLNVDFAPPVGYKEPERMGGGGSGGGSGSQNDQHAAGMEPMDVADLLPEPKGFVAFSGSGNRLDGRKKRTGSESQTTDGGEEVRDQLLVSGLLLNAKL
jgi:ubiquitin fusion degradation protein 1